MSEHDKFTSFLHLFNLLMQAVVGQHQLRFPAGAKSEKDFWRSLQSQLGVDNWALADLMEAATGSTVHKNLYQVNQAALKMLPFKTAKSLGVLPVACSDRKVRVATANPFDEQAKQAMSFVLSAYQVEYVIAPPDELEIAINHAYANSREHQAGSDIFRLDGMGTGSPGSGTSEAAIPDLARAVLRKAIEMRASDIHFQPFIGGYALRFRVDGMLERISIIPEATSESLVRFFKAMGGMDPTSNLSPQDGSMTVYGGEAYVDLRISTLPVAERHEKLVIRLLRQSGILKLKNSNLSTREIRSIHNLTQSPSGVLLFCGPTGSGKTTTLYSILSELNKENISIATVEDPVEYNMPGLSQTEVNPKAGLTFSASLRSLLRQDPDILLIGEIRDDETAEIALQSALTGHLVFSTLHTNDALSAIPRLMDLKVSPMILGQALLGVVSQRLLRKLCDHCKQPLSDQLKPQETYFKKITHSGAGFRAVGCEHCHYSGYSGRLAITEIIEMNHALRSLIGAHQSDIAMLKSCLNKDFSTLSGTASRRIISGDTTIDECLRVIGHRFWLELLEEYGSEDVEPESFPVMVSAVGIKRAVLLVGEPQAYAKDLKSLLKDSWYGLFEAASADEAAKALKEHDEIAFVFLQVPKQPNDKAYRDYVASFRKAMAWSRLPALLLLPADEVNLPAILHEDGATSPCEFTGVAPEVLLEQVNNAIAQNLDYRWKQAPHDRQ